MHDPNTSLKVLKRMKKALDEANLKNYLMCQPLGFMCPEVENDIGYVVLPEAPLCKFKKKSLTKLFL